MKTSSFYRKTKVEIFSKIPLDISCLRPYNSRCVKRLWDLSSAGRASALQAEGHTRGVESSNLPSAIFLYLFLLQLIFTFLDFIDHEKKKEKEVASFGYDFFFLFSFLNIISYSIAYCFFPNPLNPIFRSTGCEIPGTVPSLVYCQILY